jgi:hypothetical protein
MLHPQYAQHHLRVLHGAVGERCWDLKRLQYDRSHWCDCLAVLGCVHLEGEELAVYGKSISVQRVCECLRQLLISVALHF